MTFFLGSLKSGTWAGLGFGDSVGDEGVGETWGNAFLVFPSAARIMAITSVHELVDAASLLVIKSKVLMGNRVSTS